MRVPILIPTVKPMVDMLEMFNAVSETAFGRPPVYVLGSAEASASVNRNKCLDAVSGSDAVIMLDDDMSGFYPGWNHDLLEPLDRDPLVVMVSARLFRPDGRVAQTCSDNYDLTREEIEIIPGPMNVMPTAAVAFRNIPGHRFDEGFKGSGFEDTDFALTFRNYIPACKYIQSNRCRLVHANEMKQQAVNWNYNLGYFCAKWKLDVPENLIIKEFT